MLRQGVWMAIILSVFSVLNSCAHSEIIGRGEALEPKNSIVGHWEALEPKSGLVNTLEFRQDGTSKSSLLGRVYMRYRIEGDKLIRTSDDTSDNSKPKTQSDAVERSVDEGKKSADKQTGEAKTEEKQDAQSKAPEPLVCSFVLENNRLIVTYDKTGEAIDMQREGQTTAPDSIVGSWTYKHQTGEIAHIIFNTDGININRLPQPGGMEGSYEVKGDVITVMSPDKKLSQSVHYKLEDGKLILNDGKRTTTYIRSSEPR